MFSVSRTTALVALLVLGALAQTPAPALPDSFYFAVRIPSGQAVPTAAAVEYSLRSLVTGAMPTITLRTPSRPNAPWQYEFAFIGACMKIRGATAGPMRPLAMPLRRD